jgi:hypothetical protein
MGTVLSLVCPGSCRCKGKGVIHPYQGSSRQVQGKSGVEEIEGTEMRLVGEPRKAPKRAQGGVGAQETRRSTGGKR